MGSGSFPVCYLESLRGGKDAVPEVVKNGNKQRELLLNLDLNACLFFLICHSFQHI